MNAWIGPVEVGLWTPSFSWSSTPTAQGARAASISLTPEWAAAKQLVELVDNPGRQVTIAGDVGVLEYVWFADDMLRDFRGWYLLKSAGVSPQHAHGFGGDQGVVPLSISAACFGDRQPVVVRSARARVNDFGLAGSDLLAAPLAVSAGNPGFAVEPGGTVVAREFDAAHGDGAFDRDVDARSMQLRVGVVGSLPGVVLPAQEDDDKPPSWVARRGGDCRVFDVSEGREVYGPSHPLVEPSDLVIENGLIRAWCGGRGIVPYFTVMAFAAGAWRQCGCVVLADETTGPQLDGARLVSVTPDVVTAALRVRGLGDVFVSLRRGERMLRIQHGSTRAPTVSATRRVGWLGVPPTVDGIGDAANGDGEFGAGLDVAGDLVSFQWPAAAARSAWSARAAWIPPDDSASAATSGVVTVLDANGDVVASVYWDSADGAMVLVYGTDELRTPPLTFDAAEPVAAAVSFDTTNGLGFTVHTADQGVLDVTDRTIVAPSTAADPASLLIGGVPSAASGFGDLDFGEGPFGDFLPLEGAVDELVVFAGALTAAQRAALADQDAQLAALPANPRPVWYAAFDADVAPTSDVDAAGRREDSADAVGLQRFVAALQTSTNPAGFAIASSAPVTLIDLAAGLGTAAAGDSPADMHDQFAAASEQETRIR